MPSYSLTPDPIAQKGLISAGDPAERGRDKLLLGRLAESGARRELWLDISGEQVVAIFGKRGTGKSYTLGVLLEGLAAATGSSALAAKETPRAALVLDIMDIFWTSTIPLSASGSKEIQKQYQGMSKYGLKSQPLEVNIWVPAGFENKTIDPPGVRLLSIAASDLSIDDWAALFELDVYNEPRGMLIVDLVHRVGTTGYRTSEGKTVPPCPRFTFVHLLAAIDANDELTGSYQETTVRSVRQRLATYGALAVFAGESTSLQALLQPFAVSVLMLARLPDALKKVVVAVLIKRIMRERRDISFAQKRLDLDGKLQSSEATRLRDVVAKGIPRTWVLMDEAHVLVEGGSGSVASEAIIKYAKEGRNYGLSLAVATQQPSALDNRLLSQVETLVSHQLTAPLDAATAARSMRSPPPQEMKIDGESAAMEDLLRRLGQGEAVFSCGNAPSLARSCILSVRPRISAHGGYEA